MSPLFSGDSQAFYRVTRTPAPPRPSPPPGPSSHARRRHLPCLPGCGAVRRGAAPPCRPAPGPEAVAERPGGELRAGQPQLGCPPGEKHLNCGCHSAQSRKGVYYLLVKTSAGDAPALMARSPGRSPTEAPRANAGFLHSFHKCLWSD